jgi:diguanylate cyclase
MRSIELVAISDVARKALKEIARQELTPTPENYARIFYEVAGGRGQLQSSNHSTNGAKIVERIEPSLGTNSNALTDILRELLARSVRFTPSTLQIQEPDLSEQAGLLAAGIRETTSLKELENLQIKLRDFWLNVERRNVTQQEFMMELGELVKLMSTGFSELIVRDPWLELKLKSIQKLMEGKIDLVLLKRIKLKFTDILLNQGNRKSAIKDAENAVRDMVTRFIGRLSKISASTGDYHDKLNNYANLIEQTESIEQFNKVLNDLIFDTRVMQTDAFRGHEELSELRGQVADYESRILKLEEELETTSGLIREDPLTHVLNRRGLQDVFHVEITRCQRRDVPLSVAMIDIDNFKVLNDTYGHQAGDAALGHLSKIMRETLRATDWIARYGGEEFVVLLPDTDLEKGLIGINRIRTALAKQPVIYNDKCIPMTFSAGVTQKAPADKEEDMLARADCGLYQAKSAGKDRVVAAL